MNMTKRDVADISLVWITLYIVPYLFQYAIYTIYEICEFLRTQTEDSNVTTYGPNQGLSMFVSIGQFGLMAALFCLILFKRRLLLDLMFPGSEKKTLVLPDDSAIRLTDYSFWTRLFGLFIGMRSGIKLLSELLRLISPSSVKGDYFVYLLSHQGVHIVSVFLSVLVIWKAERISDLLSRAEKRVTQ
jgi:hypothetical protein